MDLNHSDDYNKYVKAELDKLYESLVRRYEEVHPARESFQEHLADSSQVSSLSTFNGHESPAVGRELMHGMSQASVDSLDTHATSQPPQPILNWALLCEGLMHQHEGELDEENDQQMSYIKDVLTMRSPWKTTLTYHALKKDNARPFSSLSRMKSLRMQEAALDQSCLQPFVRQPNSKLQIVWSLLGSLFIIWDLITIPLELFDDQNMITFLVLVGQISFVYWLLDMPSHLIFGVEVDGFLELRPRELARRYCRSWFAIDLTVIMVDALLMLLQELHGSEPEGSPVRSARYLRTLRLLRLLRLLRVAKLQQELTRLANNFLSTYAFMVMKVVSGLLMILAVNHLIACCWYGIGRWTFDSGDSWLINADIDIEDLANAYAVSIHWSLTQFTPATNNVAPVNAVERFFAVWVILLAMGTFSSFISSITTTVSTLRAARAEQFKHHSILVRFFNERNLSTDLYGKINDILKRQGAYDIRVKEQNVNLLQGIPDRLKVDLHEEMFMSSLMQLGIWRHWHHTDDFNFCREVCNLAMCEHVATPGQDAFMPGTDCEEVYIIESGSMGYIARQLTSFESELCESGEVLCLPCMWAEWLHRGRLAANTGVTCYYNGINGEKFANLVKRHGPLWQYLQIYGILFIGEVEHMDAEDIFVTDKCISATKVDDIAQRAKRLTELNNAGHRKGSKSFAATLGTISHGVGSTTKKSNSNDIPFQEKLIPI